jgi:hypothetical protein
MRFKLNNYFFKIIATAIMFVLAQQTLRSQESNLKKKLPDHIKLQYAGGIGFISIGAGYGNKKDKLEADLYYGYLPRSVGGVRIHSLSAKFIWIPYHLLIKNKAKLDPLMAGILVNYNFGKQYFGFDPENYPYKYYSFPTAINTAIFTGSRLGLNKPKDLSLYYEALIFDRDLLSLVGNPKSLHLTDVLNLSVGVKLDIR